MAVRIRDLWRMRKAMKEFRRQQEDAGNLPTMGDLIRDTSHAMESLADPATIAQLQSGAAGAYAEGSAPDQISQLERLAALRASGVLTAAEFEREKARILSS